METFRALARRIGQNNFSNKRTIDLFLLIGIVILSFWIRFSFQSLTWIPRGDEGQYQDVAKSLWMGNGYQKQTTDPESDGYRIANDIAPLYTVIVAGVHAVSGYRYRNAYYVNLAISVLLVVLVFFYTRTLFSSSLAALIASLLIAVDPVITKMTCLATKDLVFCLMALCTGFVLLYPKKKWFSPLLILSMALLILSRRNGYWFIVPLGFYFALDNTVGVQKRAIRFSIVLIGVALLVSPWYLLVRDASYNEPRDVLKFAQSSFSGGLIDFFRNWKTQVQVALHSLITSSPPVMQVALFVPFPFIFFRPGKHAWYWATALFCFICILSTRTFDDTTLDFYYLPFFPLFLMTGSAGLVMIVRKLQLRRFTHCLLVAISVFLIIFPLSDAIRNRVHPRLRLKFDERENYNQLMSLVEWLNANTEKGDQIAANSVLRQFLYEINNRVISLPIDADSFSVEYFGKTDVAWVVIGADNISDKSFSSHRQYLSYWWAVEDGNIIELDCPGFLEPHFKIDNHIVYRVLHSFSKI